MSSICWRSVLSAFLTVPGYVLAPVGGSTPWLGVSRPWPACTFLLRDRLQEQARRGPGLSSTRRLCGVSLCTKYFTLPFFSSRLEHWRKGRNHYCRFNGKGETEAGKSSGSHKQVQIQVDSLQTPISLVYTRWQFSSNIAEASYHFDICQIVCYSGISMESPTAERKMGTQEPLNLGLCVPLTSKGTDSPEPGVGKCPGSVSAKIETHWGWGGRGSWWFHQWQVAGKDWDLWHWFLTLPACSP